MNLQYQYLATEHIAARQLEAQEHRLGRRVARSRRLTRRAERLATQASVAVDRLG